MICAGRFLYCVHGVRVMVETVCIIMCDFSLLFLGFDIFSYL